MISLCVAIVTKYRYKLLREALSSIITEGSGLVSSVVIVDNGSSDDTAKFEHFGDKKLAVIHLLYNLGALRGLAIGIREALKRVWMLYCFPMTTHCFCLAQSDH